MSGTTIESAVNIVLTTLKKIDDSIIADDHIGIKQPVNVDELPSIVVSTYGLIPSHVGIGNYIGRFKPDEDHISEIRGSRISGNFQLDIWAETLEKMNDISTAVLEIFSEEKMNLRKEGFILFYLTKYGVILGKTLIDQNVLLRDLQFKFTFESQEIDEFGPTDLIKTIHVDIDHELEEEMDITKIT